MALTGRGTLASVSTESSALAPVTFYGNIIAVPAASTEVLRVAEELTEIRGSVVGILSSIPLANTHDQLIWKGLVTDLDALRGRLERDYPLYKLQVLEGLMPYLKTVAVRKTTVFSKNTDKDRFSQLQRILYVLTASEQPDEHPSACLLQLEDVSREIKRKGFMFSSELQKTLDLTVERQWTPILSDHQRLLQSLASRLTALGVVEFVGRPVLMLYPLTIAAIEVGKIVHSVSSTDPSEGLTTAQYITSAFSLLKAAGLLWAISILVNVLGEYQAMGRMCMGMGVAAFLLSANRPLLKQVVPSLAPSAHIIDSVIRQASNIEQRLVTALAGIGGHHPHHNKPPGIPAAGAPPPAIYSTTTTTTASSSSARPPTMDAGSRPPVAVVGNPLVDDGLAFVPEAVPVAEGQRVSPSDGLRRRRVN